MASRKFDRDALIEDASFLADNGITYDQACRRLKITVSGLDRILSQENREDIRERLAVNSLKRGVTKDGKMMTTVDQVNQYILKDVHENELGTCTLTERSSPLRPPHKLRFAGQHQVREGLAEWSNGALGLLPPGDVR